MNSSECKMLRSFLNDMIICTRLLPKSLKIKSIWIAVRSRISDVLNILDYVWSSQASLPYPGLSLKSWYHFYDHIT